MAALADIVVLLHFLFVLFVVCGGVLALWWPRVIWVHVPAVLWGAIIEFGGWICPLTPLENYLRRAAGGPGYEGPFLAHYILPILYPHGLTRGTQLALGAFVLLFNAAIYTWVFTRGRSAPARNDI